MEHEIKGHAVKAYKVWKNPSVGFWHKFKEIAIEIGIIVFAVSLSIWMHGRSEHSHQQKEVKAFLIGLKKDLQNDIDEMQEDKKSYNIQGKAFAYVTSIEIGSTINNDSLEKYTNYIFRTTALIQNNGRYEGFKSSGKLGNIENIGLQNDITDLYQEDIPALIGTTNSFISRKELLFQYFYKNLKNNAEKSNNLATVLLTDEAQNISKSLLFTGEILNRYNKAINKSKKIIRRIDELYN